MLENVVNESIKDIDYRNKHMSHMQNYLNPYTMAKLNIEMGRSSLQPLLPYMNYVFHYLQVNGFNLAFYTFYSKPSNIYLLRI